MKSMAVTHSDRAQADWRQGTRTSSEGSIAIIARDELVARRVESVLAADGMVVDQRNLRIDEPDFAPQTIVMTFGHGITERDLRMRQVRKYLPDAYLVAIIPEDSRRGIRRALEAGAAGVVFEDELDVALAPTVRAALAGQLAVPAARRHEIDRPTLSGREKQVLRMVVDGLSNKAIARELYLAESTVKCHLSSAFTKLGVRSRHEAADLILHSGSDLGLGIVSTPDIHATTEESDAMTTSRIHHEPRISA
jgi:DNA-binding NarL/FixJ family response regulator